MFSESDCWVLIYQEMMQRTAALTQEQFVNDVSSRFGMPDKKRRGKNTPDAKQKTPVIFS